MIEQNNEIAIKVLSDRYSDYKTKSYHYEDDYEMIVKALELAKNDESLHDVSVSCDTCKYKHEEHDKFCDSCFYHLKYEKDER